MVETATSVASGSMCAAAALAAPLVVANDCVGGVSAAFMTRGSECDHDIDDEVDKGEGTNCGGETEGG